MTDGESDGVQIACVGAIAVDQGERLLLVRRAHDPDAGCWSVPGGRVEPGEDDVTALRREMREETGLDVEVGPEVGRVRRGAFAITDYRVRVLGGRLRAGDDAAQVRWCAAAEIDTLPLVPRLAQTLREWGVLPLDERR